MLLTILWVFISMCEKSRHNEIHQDPREQLDPEKSIPYGFLYAHCIERGFHHIKISKIDDSVWYRWSKTTGVMERHFMITKLKHSITRLIIKRGRQRHGVNLWSQDSVTRSGVTSAAWRPWLGATSGGRADLFISVAGASRRSPPSSHTRGIPTTARKCAAGLF